MAFAVRAHLIRPRPGLTAHSVLGTILKLQTKAFQRAPLEG